MMAPIVWTLLTAFAATLLTTAAQADPATADTTAMKVVLDSWGRVTLEMPRKYVDYRDVFAAMTGSPFAAERQSDLAFAHASGTLEIAEGPWGTMPVRPVFYIGVDKGGRRVALTRIPEAWRYSPTQIAVNGGTIWIVAANDSPLIEVIRLGINADGLQVKVPDRTNDFTQLNGQLDGQDLRFETDESWWSLAIGGDVDASPVWFHREPCGELDCATTEAIYRLIKSGVQLFRSGIPSMALPS